MFYIYYSHNEQPDEFKTEKEAQEHMRAVLKKNPALNNFPFPFIQDQYGPDMYSILTESN
jgi:hypothetical protein